MKVLVFAESREGKLKGSSAEAVSAAKKLGGEVHAVVLDGKAADIAPELAQYGATKVFTVNNELTNTYQNEAFTQALNELIQQGGYNTVVGVATPMGRDFFPRLAARNKAALLTDVIELSAEGEKVKAHRPIYAGKCIVDVEPVALTFVTIRPNVFVKEVTDAGATAELAEFSPNISADSVKAKTIEIRKGQNERPDLTEASVIISGGRAVGSADNFKLLYEPADTIGASVGSSRAAVDSGYAPHDLHIGQTGVTVGGSLRPTLGISGAIQHLAGMRAKNHRSC